MRWARVLHLGIELASLGTIFGDAARAADTPLVLREQLNQTYGPQSVSYPFTAGEGECLAESVRVSGPRGPVPAQLSEIELWPNGKFVKSARLIFIIDALAPLATESYTVAYGKDKAPAPASDLKIAAAKESVELTTPHVGVRLPLGGAQFPTPVAAKDVPGPLLGMRLGNGAWAGGSALTGDAAVRSWSAQLTESGPAFARVRMTYTFADGNALTLAAMLVAGDRAVRWEMAVRDDRPDQGIAFRLPPVPGVKEVLLPKGYGQWAKEDRKLAVAPSDKPLCYLSPDSSMVNGFPEDPPKIRWVTEAGTELQLASRDPGAWVDPVAPFTYGGFKTWNLDMIPLAWEHWKRKRMPVSYAADGAVTLQASLAKGQRKWRMGAGGTAVGEDLDRIKEMVLDWPETDTAHPHLFMSKAEMEGKRSKEDLAKIVAALRESLAKLGNFDVMRIAIAVAGQYDAVIDSGLLSPADRALFRAQFAYLAYLMADPMCWSIERGYHSGNPNMSCSYTLSQGVLACAIPDHPMAKTWADYATRWEEKWLADEVGTNGEWVSEGTHYGYVSLAPMLSYALAAQRAGFHDFLNDPRLKQVILYFAKYNTPRDPMRGGFRILPSFGRGAMGDRLGVFGMAARMYAGRDNVFSRQMQWLWAENGYPTELGDFRLGGHEPFYMDKKLPAEAPKWGSELFPSLGGLLRHGFGTPNESSVNVLSQVGSRHCLDIWAPEAGGIAQWFARGKPLSSRFAFRMGYRERHELLRDGVRLAHNWGAPGDTKTPFGCYTEVKNPAFAALPTVDYVRTTLINTKVDDRDWFPDNLPAYPRQTPATASTLEWTRQLLFLKEADPAGPSYLVLRDTTCGGQPTAWQFWSFSEKIGTPAQAADTNFLAEKPGQNILPARELPMSDRYTALGQFGVDVDYFVASPTATPRHTLRYGGTQANNKVPDYQDLLHLQLPGDGAYFVALFPRSHSEAAPIFSQHAEGKIMKIVGAFGTDFVFMASEETAAAVEGASFRGTAGTVQQRGADTTLSIASAGEVRWKDFGLSAPVAVALRVSNDTLTVSGSGEITLTAPGGWTLQQPAAGVKLDRRDGTYRLTIPGALASVVLVKKK
jgi:hypothetical protein